jgi:hypothetical protein
MRRRTLSNIYIAVFFLLGTATFFYHYTLGEKVCIKTVNAEFRRELKIEHLRFDVLANSVDYLTLLESNREFQKQLAQIENQQQVTR